MSQQDLLIIIAIALIWWMSQQTPRRPYEPPGPVGVAFLILFEAVAVAVVCALIAVATWFLIMRH